MSSDLTKVWTEELQNLIRRCVPPEIRTAVLTALLERERVEKPFRVIGIDELMAMEFADYRTKKEAASLMVQVLVRSVANNFSKEDAAAILFRDHYGLGTGSGWLPDYLDGLPGLRVDLKKCAAISKAVGSSRLREAMIETAGHIEQME